eukprot:CAMPEP_0115468548 /NCGR_PEP_ID=MMETSP0271-20121206/51011_1 /TAXON_ID=71861 /ORGANISM="Scrippsiella trochoidea, Strain CCMP3099" /LENGTH=80 /DNA_ID=CAMNT_0002895599 /DNA_START=57 /DNA_END=296 /DNA_ORIENTATION=+
MVANMKDRIKRQTHDTIFEVTGGSTSVNLEDIYLYIDQGSGDTSFLQAAWVNATGYIEITVHIKIFNFVQVVRVVFEKAV